MNQSVRKSKRLEIRNLMAGSPDKTRTTVGVAIYYKTYYTGLVFSAVAFHSCGLIKAVPMGLN